MGWIFRVTLKNLRRRKIRTVLTVLGIAIGIVSVVTLVGAGKGIKKQILSEFDDGNQVKRIMVYSKNNDNKYKMLTDRRISELKNIQGVANVYPVLEEGFMLKIDSYEAYIQVIGIPEVELQKLSLASGEIVNSGKSKPAFVVGDLVTEMFYLRNGEKNYLEATGTKAIDLQGKRIEGQLVSLKNSGRDRFDIMATLEGKEDSYTIDSQNVYCDIETLKKYCRKKGENGVAVNQPVDSSGNPYHEWIYSYAVVEVDKVDDVEFMVKKLQDMGYITQNDKEYLDSIKKVTRLIEVLFGAIGAIALVVAVIGISNTMTTAVYDRIKEIGILKVLGCDTDELRGMFLLESGILGFIGGFVGIIFALLVTGGINKVCNIIFKLPKGTLIISTDPTMLVMTLIFAICLGVFAGAIPAVLASRIKPIEAMTNLD